MHSNTILATLAAFTFATAFKVPAGTPNGVYMVTYENGVAIHTPLNTTSSATKPVAQRKRRDSRTLGRRGDLDDWDADGQIYCWDGMTLDPADTDAANAAVDAQCNAGVQVTNGKPHIYSKAGSVVAYFCMRDGGDSAGSGTACDSGLRGQYDARITTMCGKYMGGEQEYDDDAGFFTFGYATEATDFCIHEDE